MSIKFTSSPFATDLSTMDDRIEFSLQASGKIIMHAMKYPHCTCSGFLLSSGTEDDTTRIIEAIPVSHGSNYLTPNIEVAFNSISKYASERNLVISGYYVTDSPNTFNQRIAEKICETFPKAVLCCVSIDGDPINSYLNPHQLVDGKWRRKASQAVEADKIFFTKEKLYRKVIDFDDHFNNISLDWTNAAISRRIVEQGPK